LEGCVVVLAGTARDLRFLTDRVAKAAKTKVAHVGNWMEATAAPDGSLLSMEAPVDRGFRRGNVVVVSAADLLGSRADRGDAQAGVDDATLFALDEVRVGDVVVHEDHGIGLVRGLEDVQADGTDEAIAIEHAGGAVRLIQVSEADKLWRYGADADAVALDKLDGSTWTKRRETIDEAIAEAATALIEMAAARDGLTAPVITPDAARYEKFASGFAFTETRDQARAIESVRTDLASGVPMDRLVIGDVGYGKTEVALRAAALAALAGYQVAVAAPTTVLARQHLETFTRRFEGTGLEVAGLSRLSSASERKRVKAGMADGSIAVVVGTGAVAGKGLSYSNLALVVIDEEQRFGVADKNRLRELGAGHALSLSATPIPRTLQNALIGIQQLSVIASPPARRQPIRTSVGSFNGDTVRAALLRERSRGGQSFFVLPRIEDMSAVAETLGKLVPELEVLSAHGKMPAAEIDETMVRFGRGDGDVLLATNIIEAGLDVPRANTMVIWRADRFGLSQLHQLRGRVGRGGRRGQVMLLTEGGKSIAPRTLKRLRTLEAFDRLGAGFEISARDLDMRGAGDLLGEAQAGHMKMIGIDLYQYFLEAALRAARGEAVERWSPDLNLGVSGRLPATWIPEPELRVTFYVRLARARDAAAIDSIEEELEDRFGPVPQVAATLLTVSRIRTLAREAGVARIDAGPAAIAFTMRAGSSDRLEGLGLDEKDGRYLFAQRIEDAGERLERIDEILSGACSG
jgi:transcription-repair coupling factor (superfamily II helicase)